MKTSSNHVASLVIACACAFGLSVGCGDDVEPPADECGGWAPDPQTPGAECVEDFDCGDPGVCVAPRCYGGKCVYEDAPAGMQCSQCNVEGVCDGLGTCASQAEWVPTVDCADEDPCTDDMYTSNSCEHVYRGDGALCVGSGDRQGVCELGNCVVQKWDAKAAVCTAPADECVDGGAYVLKQLDGSCYAEWCNLQGHGKSVLPRPAGSPCVRRVAPGVPEWIAGQCSACGTCL